MADPKSEIAAAIARAQADLEAAVAELDRLPALDSRSIALAAHALNNFLTVSVAVVDFLLKSLRDHPDPQVHTWLEALSHTSNLMGHTVSQLMNNSVGIASRLRLEETDLGTLVGNACAYYRRGADLKNIALSVSVGPDVPKVRTDRVLVAAVLDNLLSNAVKYSLPGKHIWVRVQSADAGARAHCSVRDEGPGLSKEDQTRLYVPGARLGTVPSGGEASTGYGLAIAKRFVQQLGGEIRCASMPGEGSTFSFWLPVRGPRDSA